MKNLSELAASLQTKISVLFPGSHVSVFSDENLCSSLTLRFSMEPKENWPSGIFYNSKCFMLGMVMCNNARYESDGNFNHTYDLSYGPARLPFNLRAKNKATLCQMEKYIMAIFEKLKENK